MRVKNKYCKNENQYQRVQWYVFRNYWLTDRILPSCYQKKLIFKNIFIYLKKVLPVLLLSMDTAFKYFWNSISAFGQGGIEFYFFKPTSVHNNVNESQLHNVWPSHLCKLLLLSYCSVTLSVINLMGLQQTLLSWPQCLFCLFTCVKPRLTCRFLNPGMNTRLMWFYGI